MFDIFKVADRFHLTKLLISIGISEGVGVLSSFFTKDSMVQYKTLIQPPFAPPAWIFGPVWTLLFFLMGLAAYRIWMYSSINPNVSEALTYYGIQLFLNFLWSILFFKLGLRGLAFVEILILLYFIIITTVKFYRIDKTAGYLLIPYILWAVFASILNFSIWQLNR